MGCLGCRVPTISPPNLHRDSTSDWRVGLSNGPVLTSKRPFLERLCQIGSVGLAGRGVAILYCERGTKDVDGLTYKEDGRSTEPNVNTSRKGRFKAGWNDAAIREKEYDATTLETLYWQNLGYRFGKLLGETSEELQEEMYELCVKQQKEKQGR
uniref:Uncharacterized protein n=1 Tax=Solibacter usitatus (strain Ellin6076) TaxID=234267 RepID=Q01TQ2_SOLUE